MSVLATLVTLVTLQLVLIQVSSYSVYSTTKAYDLQVPGSTPIRIIEADPIWDVVDVRDHPITEKYNSDLEHRTLRTVSSTTQHTKTTLGNPILQRQEQDAADYEDMDEEASSSRLKDFLEKYSAAKIKSKLQDNNHHNDPDIPSLENVEIFTKSPESLRDKSKAWNIHLGSDNSYDEKKSWVSLEAVPWSVSKISKWHTNNVKPSTLNDKVWSGDDYTYTPKPNVVTRPNGYNYDHQELRPSSFSKPTAMYAQKVHIEYTTDRHEKPWLSQQQSNYLQQQVKPIYSQQHQQQHQHTDNCNHGNSHRYANNYGDVITDGQPANFPESQQESYNRRAGGSQDFAHVSHPFNGDGEWVLLSTTKGYKYPQRNHRERSMQFNSALNHPENTNIVDAHKAVRLTVLPPAKGSRVNMTTSHGGLLQVESTFQTVDQAQKAFAKRQKQKHQQKHKRRKPVLRKRKVLSVAPSNGVIDADYPAQTQLVDDNRPDTSTVLAAVGAGMIPATMALMVPMALNGRRRRRRRRDVAVEGRFPPAMMREMTLPQSL